MTGPGGRRGGRGRWRGRGRRAGAATPPRLLSPAPSSSLEEARCFEFALRIAEDPLGIKRLPDRFVEGHEPAEMQLREATRAFCRWPVDVIFNGQGKMYLHTGWEKFSIVHKLEDGCLLTFLYKSDVEMAAKVFDGMSSRRHYHTDNSGEDTDN